MKCTISDWYYAHFCEANNLLAKLSVKAALWNWAPMFRLCFILIICHHRERLLRQPLTLPIDRVMRPAAWPSSETVWSHAWSSLGRGYSAARCLVDSYYSSASCWGSGACCGWRDGRASSEGLGTCHSWFKKKKINNNFLKFVRMIADIKKRIQFILF